jgi:hypothetical protein
MSLYTPNVIGNGTANVCASRKGLFAERSVVLSDHDRMNDVYDIMYGNLFTRHDWIKALGAIVTYRPHTEADFKRACDVILENQDAILENHGKDLSADALDFFDFVKRSKENLQEAIESIDIVRVVNALMTLC